jgi:hypothetical protein
VIEKPPSSDDDELEHGSDNDESLAYSESEEEEQEGEERRPRMSDEKKRKLLEARKLVKTGMGPARQWNHSRSSRPIGSCQLWIVATSILTARITTVMIMPKR